VPDNWAELDSFSDSLTKRIVRNQNSSLKHGTWILIVIQTKVVLKSSKKNGGPYTKPEQDERRKQVYHLYFEMSYPIVKIAEKLDVNRKTISEDLKYFYSESAEQWKQQDLFSSILLHMERLEAQKMRLSEESQKTDLIKEKLAIEKLLFSIESKLGQIGIKLLENISKNSEPEDPEKEIREIVSHLINIKNKGSCFFTEDEICYEILKFKKCDELHAENYFDEMNDLGLGYCEIEKKKPDEPEVFDIKKFAEIRGYQI